MFSVRAPYKPVLTTCRSSCPVLTSYGNHTPTPDSRHPKQRKYVDTYLCWSRCLFRGKFHMLIFPFLPEFLHLVTCTMNQPVVFELCLVLTNSTLHLHPLDPKILGSEFWPSACLPCTWWFIACSGIPITVCWLHFRTQTTSFCIFDARSLFG